MAKRAAFHSGSPGVSLSSSTSRASCHVAPPQIVAAPTATSIFDMGMASCARSFVCARVCVCVCIGAHNGRALLLLYEKMIVLGSCAPVGLLCVGACGECCTRVVVLVVDRSLVWSGGGASHWKTLQGLASEGDCLAGDGRTGAQLFCVALAQSFFVAKLLFSSAFGVRSDTFTSGLSKRNAMWA
jgi:hypothetical protein